MIFMLIQVSPFIYSSQFNIVPVQYLREKNEMKVLLLNLTPEIETKTNSFRLRSYFRKFLQR